MDKILVTGSTGFVGKRLTFALAQEGLEVYALSRYKGIEFSHLENLKITTLFGDLQNDDLTFPQDISVAYYLLHSLSSVTPNLSELESRIAANFINLIEKTNCQQIIYLGGIIEDENELSPHLKSRLQVENILKKSKIPCTILRASIIIGAGSASFEIIRDLVEVLPVMIAPKWVRNSCQPISISDVLFYLKAVLLKKECFNEIFDIGGPEPLTFSEVLLKYAKFRGLKRYIINVPVLTPRLSSYWLVLISSVKFSLCRYLVESLKTNTRKLKTEIDQIIPHECLTYDRSLKMAFLKIEQNEVVSTWMDSWEVENQRFDIADYVKVPSQGCLFDKQIYKIETNVETVKDRLWSIGGKNGWFSMDWAWSLRGLIDKCFGGSGMNRGRRHPTEIEAGDSIDFWRVVVCDPNRNHLMLFAEMKLPGEAWLDFVIDEENMTLTQTATFRPKGIFGRLYWYCLIPFHWIIFKNMAKSLTKVDETSKT